MTQNQTETFDDAPGRLGPEEMLALPHLFVVVECDRPSAGGARYCLSGPGEVIELLERLASSARMPSLSLTRAST